MLTKTGLSDMVEPSSSPENFDSEGAAMKFQQLFRATGDYMKGPTPFRILTKRSQYERTEL
jgi:hypothetical protein